MRPLARLLFDTWRLPRILGDFSPDVVLALDSSHGFRRPPALQGVFLQAAHLVYPNDHYGPRSMLNRLRHAFLKWHFGRSLRRTAAVFVQTEVMASRLRRAYPFAGEISVAGSTLSGSLRSVADEASPPEALAPYSERFKLLSVAHYYPHKGVERIIDAFRRFPDELADVVVFLTLDSRQHPRVPGVLRSIEELGLSDRIVNLGEVHHDEIGKYYLHCDALLKPSTLESFGMTYIEAMAWGLPILTSDMDFAHEACGDAALYFDPLDPRAMRDAIVELRDNPTLLSQLASAGRATVHFERSWSDIGAEVLQVMAGRAGADHRPGRTAGG
jgi:glycosyltransferase involved in cell wall biosynthesis